MTEAGWTRSTDVTQPGWYWLRRVGRLAVVEVIDVPGYQPEHWIVEGFNLRWSLGNMDGEWLGPITPDSFQHGRVAGLREAHVFAMEVGAFYTAHRIGALIDKAQQAQEEGVGDA